MKIKLMIKREKTTFSHKSLLFGCNFYIFWFIFINLFIFYILCIIFTLKKWDYQNANMDIYFNSFINNSAINLFV